MAPSTRMTQKEREAFLAERHVGVISIEDPGRAPLSAPIWYDFAPGRGAWVITGAATRKGIALERAGRFTLVAQQEDMPYKYVSVEGPIVETREVDKEADARPMAWRYLGPELGDAYVDGPSDEAGASIVYRMQPQRWLTVDYAKALS